MRDYLNLAVTVLIALAALAVVPASGQSSSAQVPDGKVYVYKNSDDLVREMEVYFPKDHDQAEEPVPGVIMFHGGGWTGGKRQQFQYVCHYLASRGLVAATVTYKFSPKKYDGPGSGKRICITDAKSAIRWFKQNAEQLGIDPQRVIAGGGSAGGHISLLATTNPGLNDTQDPAEIDTSVAAYLLFNPAFALSDSQDPEVDFLKHLNSNLKPAIFFFGSKDKKWLEGWGSVHEKLKSLGSNSHEYWFAENQKHGFFNKQPWAEITAAACDKFLSKLGLIEGEPTFQSTKDGAELVEQP